MFLSHSKKHFVYPTQPNRLWKVQALQRYHPLCFDTKRPQVELFSTFLPGKKRIHNCKIHSKCGSVFTVPLFLTFWGFQCSIPQSLNQPTKINKTVVNTDSYVISVFSGNLLIISTFELMMKNSWGFDQPPAWWHNSLAQADGIAERHGNSRGSAHEPSTALSNLKFFRLLGGTQPKPSRNRGTGQNDCPKHPPKHGFNSLKSTKHVGWVWSQACRDLPKLGSRSMVTFHGSHCFVVVAVVSRDCSVNTWAPLQLCSTIIFRYTGNPPSVLRVVFPFVTAGSSQTQNQPAMCFQANLLCLRSSAHIGASGKEKTHCHWQPSKLQVHHLAS